MSIVNSNLNQDIPVVFQTSVQLLLLHDYLPFLLLQVEDPDKLPDETPFAQTKELAVSIPIYKIGKADIYIDDDDTMGIALDKGDNVK